jgi:acetyl esterase/lipase/type 1 glutamine amidotransferase
LATHQIWLAIVMGLACSAGHLCAVEMEQIYDVPYGPHELQRLDIYRPKGVSGPLPTVVWIHGGGWTAEDKRTGSNGIHALAPALVDKGFIAVSCNYRLVPAHRHPAQVDDVQRVIRWLRANADRYGIDPDRIGAAGISAGGHLSAMLAVRDTRATPGDELDKFSSRVQTAICINGPTDLRGNRPELVTPIITGAVNNLVGGDGPAAAEARSDASPLVFVDGKAAPVLFIVGVEDTWVPPAHGRLMAAALRASKVESRVMEIAGAGHAVFPSTTPGVIGAMTEWFDRTLRSGAGLKSANDSKAGPQRSRALILTGYDGPFHDWRKTTAALTRSLELDARLAVEVTENIEDLATRPLHEYQVLILNYSNWDRPGLSEPAKQKFLDYLQQGGGLAVIHFANGAFHGSLPNNPNCDWPEYRRIVRRVWDSKAGSGHDNYGPFRVQIAATDHPIIRGLEPFDTVDELYFNQAGEEPIVPLVFARSKITGKDEPLAWAYEYGGARVFQTLLGHSDASIDAASKLIRRGILWAAGVGDLDTPPQATGK